MNKTLTRCENCHFGHFLEDPHTCKVFETTQQEIKLPSCMYCGKETSHPKYVRCGSHKNMPLRLQVKETTRKNVREFAKKKCPICDDKFVPTRIRPHYCDKHIGHVGTSTIDIK